MQECNIINNIHYISSWISIHQKILLTYIFNIITATIIMITGIFTSQTISNTFNKILYNRNVDTTISDFLTIIARYIIVMISVVIALGRLGVQTTSVIAILGAAGMAIGLALQGSLSNFAASVLLIIFSPLRVGEYVVLKNIAGTVLNIHVFYTTLKTLDGKIIVVPNSKITSNNIINYSREPCRRNEFTINVTNTANVDLVIKILKDVIYKEPRVLKDKDVTVGLNKLEPYSMNFIARCWSNTNILNAVYWDLMIQFKKALDDNKIELPCKTLEIYINRKNKI